VFGPDIPDRICVITSRLRLRLRLLLLLLLLTFAKSHTQVHIVCDSVDEELPLGFNSHMDVKQRDEAIQRIKKHKPSFHIDGLSRDGARRKILHTYTKNVGCFMSSGTKYSRVPPSISLNQSTS
jgi:hypothetical protein